MVDWQDEPCKYRYVTKRLPGNASRMKPGFYAVYRNKSVGPFLKQADAAAAASKLCGVPVRNLAKAMPKQADPQLTRPLLIC